MRRYLTLLILLALVALVGCGTTSKHSAFVSAGQSVLSSQIAACMSSRALEPPCTAIVPEGASGLRASFVEGPLPLTLIGGAIQLDNFGSELTAGFENVVKSYYCPEPDPAYGWAIPTRGLGETGGIKRDSPCISRAQALANLRYLMDTQYLGPVRGLGVNFSHPQVDALGDLSWNTGPGTICCELANLLRAHAWYSAAIYIRRYSYANGEFLPGLYSRRVREGELLQRTEPAPKPETPSQRRAREERELAGHKIVLDQLRVRQRVLRRELAVKGCYPRLKAHRAGPVCKRYKREGNEVSAHGRYEDGVIKRLEGELR